MSIGDGKGIENLTPGMRKSIFSDNSNLKKALTSGLDFAKQDSKEKGDNKKADKARNLLQKAVAKINQGGLNSEELMGKLNKLAEGTGKDKDESQIKKKKVAKSTTELPKSKTELNWGYAFLAWRSI